ncbi:MAG TPA: FG-GAP-like repeat-containing protein [Pyrinomonadaceae bacterium]|nr:FG-GAP-like repeat-containing protein [Pyrinomonadaceae bacterium]
MTWSLDASSSAADCATPSFGPPTFYNAGSVRFIAADDFDNDGSQDLALTQTPGFSLIGLFLNDGTSAFTYRVALGNGQLRPPARSIATGDFNGDGLADMVIANENWRGAHASVFLNDNLFFQMEVGLLWTSPGSGSISSSVAAADFNADGKSDVAVTSTDANAVLVALGGERGNFTNFKTFSSGGLSPAHVVAQDFNGDGKIDLAVANPSNGGNNVAILLGDGTGNFSAATTYAAGTSPSFIAAGDFNADNKIDLAVVAHGGLQNISILLGNGAGAFAAPTHISSGGTTAANLAAVDFNGDGKIDIAVVNPQEGNIAILSGNGAGNFNLSASFATGVASPSFLITPDLNGDGKPDLAVVHESARRITVLLNNCGATVASLSFNAPGYGAVESDNAVTVTVNRDGSLAGVVTIDYNTFEVDSSDRAISPSDYKATSGTLTFADGESTKTFTVELINDSLDESTERLLVKLSNPTGSAVLRGDGITGVTIGDDDPQLTFSVNNPSVTEGKDRVTLTVTRTSDQSGIAYIDYRTEDSDTFTVGCSDATRNGGAAYGRCDFATTAGRIDFAAGETQKTITIPIIDDGHDEGPETFRVLLSNSSRPTIGIGAVGIITIEDNDAANAANPIFTTPFFVRQQYLDFLSREPEAGEPWSAILNNCPNVNNNPLCDRILVSQSFFGSPEFQLKGFYVFRFYKVAFNRLPQYAEIVADMSFVAGATPEEVYARKEQFAVSFTQLREFSRAYDDLTNEAFVSALLSRYQITQITTPDPAQPDGTAKVTLTQAALVNRLDTDALRRAQVLRAVADSDEVSAREFNNAFVAMQYYGYLRRKPEPAGYEAWLGVLRRGDIRTMIDGFMNSTEYKLRFGRL